MRSKIDAARRALNEKAFIITGGPGTGKTTLLMSILTVLRRARVSFALAAPTGRAAKRMTESTGEAAITTPSSAGIQSARRRLSTHEDNPLQVDL